MRSAGEYRWMAREALRGKWMLAVGVGAVAALLGGAGVNVSTGSSATAQGEIGLREVVAMGSAMRMATMFSIIMAVVTLVIGGVMNMGYAHFNLRLIDREENLHLGNLFEHFDRIPAGIGMVLLQTLYIILWALPGILICGVITYFLVEPIVAQSVGLSYEEVMMTVGTVVIPIMLVAMLPAVFASYRYALVPYLMAENRQMRVRDAFRESVRRMKGNIWRMFCLQMSFLGWDVLCMFTMGIGNLFLIPYRMAAQSAFARDLLPRKQEPQHWEDYYLLGEGSEFE